MKYLILNNKNSIKSIIDYLINIMSLPKIQRRLNIFAEDDSLRIEIFNNIISYREKNRTKEIYIENKNLKYFFQILDNKKKYFINDISFLAFENCSLLFNTYHGTILSIEDENLCYDLENKFDLARYDNINEHNFVIKPKPEYLFESNPAFSSTFG